MACHCFHDFFFASFNSLSFHCSIPAPYLNTATVYAFIAVISFFPFSFDFRTKRNLYLYYFIVSSFQFIFFELIQLNYAQICVSFLLDLLYYFTNWELYFFGSNYFPFHHGKNVPFFIQNSILVSVLMACTVFTNVSICSSLLENSFKSSMSNTLFSFYSFVPYSQCVFTFLSINNNSTILKTNKC